MTPYQKYLKFITDDDSAIIQEMKTTLRKELIDEIDKCFLSFNPTHFMDPGGEIGFLHASLHVVVSRSFEKVLRDMENFIDNMILEKMKEKKT